MVIAYPIASLDLISLLHYPAMVINDPGYEYVFTCCKTLMKVQLLKLTGVSLSTANASSSVIFRC